MAYVIGVWDGKYYVVAEKIIQYCNEISIIVGED